MVVNSFVFILQLRSCPVEGVIYSLVSAVCWAANGVFYKKAVSKVSTFTANFHRTLVATALFSIPALPVIGEMLGVDVTTMLVLVASAFFSFYLGDSFYMASLKRCPVSVALPVSSTYPIYVVLLSPLIYNTKPTISAFVSALLVFLAVLIVYMRKERVNFLGVFFALMAAVSWSIAILSLDYLTAKLPVSLVAFVRMLMCLAMLAPFAKFEELDERESIIYAGFLGGLLTFIGVFLFISAVNISGSWRVVQPSATSPVISAVMGKVIFKERIDVRLIVSIALIVLSTLLLLL